MSAPLAALVALERDVLHVLFLMVRPGAALMAAPVFGAMGVPVQVRLLFGAALAVYVAVWLPVAPLADPLSLAGAAAVAAEVALGLAIGFSLQLAFAAPALAAELVAGSMGMAMASAVDPATGGQAGALAQFHGLVLALVFLGLDAHLIWLRLLLESFAAVPPGSGLAPDRAYALARFATTLFAAGATLALPAALALLLVQVATGVISRAAPALNLFALGLPAGVLVGLVALIAGFSLFTEQLANLVGTALAQAQEAAAR
ncbi:type III secretion protein [Erythrobacteraceae bacterium CFH 75059]|uniref:flagellar biosynthetic protein FliR n=1 Tax=Qipengyuania thermophila TaxID=2509361 RepID=UPI0010223FAA|nr:flagellar biosynthetic protein FliR [Qipengyuania thermophila]TCD06300.1 type III secretion protein [Erythrobacteraceae bacterium CFH 75059]